MRIPHIGKAQASPLRQRAAAFACELPGQHDFLAALADAEDVRAELAKPAVIAAHHLLFGENGVAEQDVGRTGHRGTPWTEVVQLTPDFS